MALRKRQGNDEWCCHWAGSSSTRLPIVLSMLMFPHAGLLPSNPPSWSWAQSARPVQQQESEKADLVKMHWWEPSQCAQEQTCSLVSSTACHYHPSTAGAFHHMKAMRPGTWRAAFCLQRVNLPPHPPLPSPPSPPSQESLDNNASMNLVVLVLASPPRTFPTTAHRRLLSRDAAFPFCATEPPIPRQSPPGVSLPASSWGR